MEVRRAEVEWVRHGLIDFISHLYIDIHHIHTTDQ